MSWLLPFGCVCLGLSWLISWLDRRQQRRATQQFWAEHMERK